MPPSVDPCIKDLPLSCACGALQGEALCVAPNTGVRMLCYCDDCQAFARFLGRRGIVDEWGGTDVVQLAPARIRLNDVRGLRCLRLSPTGLYRFYCGECRTPLGNSLGPRVPFISLFLPMMDGKGDARWREQHLGLPVGYVQTKFARNGLPRRKTQVLRVIAKTVGLLGKWWLTGAGVPSPLFGRDRLPRADPQVLSVEQRTALAKTM